MFDFGFQENKRSKITKTNTYKCYQIESQRSLTKMILLKYRLNDRNLSHLL